MASQDYTSDTSLEALNVQIVGLRAMTPEQRIERMCSMSHRVRDMAFAAIRRRHPDFTDDEVQNKFFELNFGQALADDIRRWKEANNG